MLLGKETDTGRVLHHSRNVLGSFQRFSTSNQCMRLNTATVTLPQPRVPGGQTTLSQQPKPKNRFPVSLIAELARLGTDTLAVPDFQ